MPINFDDPNEFAELAKRLGVDPQVLARELQREEDTGHILVRRHVDPIGDGLAGAQHLTEYFNDKLPNAEVPHALGGVFRGVTAKAPIEEHPADRNLKRPKVDGLLECGYQFLDVTGNREFEADMGIARLDRGRLKDLLSQIAFRRDLLSETGSFLDGVLGDTRALEREAADLMGTAYENVRAGCKKDPRLTNATNHIEDYFYGAAQQGAGTRAKVAGAKGALQDSVGKTNFVKGKEAGQQEMMDKLEAMLAEANNQTSFPPATTPATPATPTHHGHTTNPKKK